MKTANELKTIVAGQKEKLRRQYYIKEIAIFGSYARGGQTDKRDIHILVEFKKPTGLACVELTDYMEHLLGEKVDVVSRGANKPRMWEYGEGDVLYV